MILIFILAGLVAGAASATDYYVSSVHPNRSDATPGTSPEAPWATMDKVRAVLNGLNPGDTVYLERGSVFEVNTSSGFDGSNYLNFQNNGTAGNPITLTGVGYGSGNKPIIRRTGGSGPDSFIQIRSNYIIVRDIELDGNMEAGFATSGIGLWTDGSWDGDNGTIHDVQILNMDLHSLGGSASGTDRYICGISLKAAAGRSINNCLIEGNRVSDYSAHGLNDYAGDFSNNIWRNNVVSNSYPHRDYTVNSALQVGTGTDNVFEHNYLYDSTLTSAGAIVRIAGKDNDSGLNTIRFNVIAGSGNHGIHFVQSNERGPWLMLYDIYGNIIHNCVNSGIIVQPSGDWKSGSTVNIYNNTLYSNQTSGGDTYDGEIVIGSGANNTVINLKNNLIYHPDSASSVCLVLDPNHNATISHNNNLYYRTGNAAKTAINDGGTLRTLSNVTLYETSAQNTDPLFVNPAAPPISANYTSGADPNGLSVQAASPAIGNGAGLGSSYALDINRDTRTAPWDIGAYQSGEGGEAQIPAPPSLPRIVPDI